MESHYFQYILLIFIFLYIYYLFNKKQEKSNGTYNNNYNDHIKQQNEKKEEEANNVVIPYYNSHEVNLQSNHLDIDCLGIDQRKVFMLMEESNDNLFVTGKAGTGKSYLLKYFLKNSRKRSIVLAPTGVSAINVGGQTIHSFFKIPPDFTLDEIELKPYVNSKTKKIIQHADLIIIDEISMVRADLLKAVDIKMRYATGIDLPFGGKRMIFFGDLYQLPPVVQDGEILKYLENNFGGIYFFNAINKIKAEFNIVELNHVYRQSDQIFINILNKIREGIVDDEILNTLNRRVKKPVNKNYITLTARNATASRINDENLMQLNGKEYVFNARINGNLARGYFPAEEKLCLKVGAQVMMLNNDPNKRWVNGTIAKIHSISYDHDYIVVNINNNLYKVSRYKWPQYKYEYDEHMNKIKKIEVASFEQFPVKLAWAITIHKSQGQTYDTIYIDMEGGHLYRGKFM
ncbi:ATP-dependent RecD-like DNA helicase [Thermopetrobacter sp. TC1]|uniref:ATP-dependent DNA helicase n=1 Tax=Thermopetrobacter sp. TC1 TaxID=1495045 RepID=UPI0009E06957|nr:AAA family ATPase [Thermopetrobacter sp. TC1]